MVPSVMALMAQNWYPTFGIITKVDGLSISHGVVGVFAPVTIKQKPKIALIRLREVDSRDGA